MKNYAEIVPLNWGDPVVSELPTGTVTLLLADVEGSTRLWENQSEQMAAAIAHLNTVVTELVARHRGVRPLEQGEGDSFVVAFAKASDAVPNTLIEYKITKGSPLRGHWGRQELTPTPSGGTRLNYTIGFDSAIPGLAALVGKVLTSAITKGLPKLTD